MIKLLRLPAVIERTGKSRSAIYSDPTFPSPVKIGQRSVAWSSSDIDAWIQLRIQAK